MLGFFNYFTPLPPSHGYTGLSKGKGFLPFTHPKKPIWTRAIVLLKGTYGTKIKINLPET